MFICYKYFYRCQFNIFIVRHREEACGELTPFRLVQPVITSPASQVTDTLSFSCLPDTALTTVWQTMVVSVVAVFVDPRLAWAR